MANHVEVEREGADITAAYMVIPEETPSEIRKFYDKSTIFLTGGSGFIGQLTVEKLLRACPDIKRIYLLMRPKKGKDPQQRLEEMFDDIVYERLKIENPKYFEKITLVLGDCEQPNLGLNPEDIQTLINQVNVVFHIAATVRFDEKIRKAININVRGTRDILKLSSKMKNLKAFVHISTAFSNCPNHDIDEIFYETDMTGDKLIQLTDLLNDEQMDAFTPTLIGKWPNTYTYTKAIAENVVRQYGKNLPVSILRPSIVACTYKEPVAGWINNYYGVVGISMGAGVGLLRSFHCMPDYAADVIPVDYCVNAIITSAWVVGQSHGDVNVETPKNVIFDDLKMEDNIPIFNYVSSTENLLTWRKFMSYCELYGLKHPSLFCVWYYCFTLQTNKYLHYLYVVFLHYIPGIIIDASLIITGRPPRLLKMYKKIHKLTSVLTYFTLKEWNFKNHNTQTIWKKLNATDKRLFEFDMKKMEWAEYIYTCVRGGRVYLLKDPLETLPKAQIKYKRMKIAHYTIATIFWLFVFKVIWMIASPFF